MNVGFIGDERIWWVPDNALAAIGAAVRRQNSDDADALADAIEVGLETGARTHVMDDRDQPDFLAALEQWVDERADPPDWAVTLRDDLRRV